MSVHKFYRLKVLITLEQVNTTESSEKKNKNLNEQNCDAWSGVVNFHCMQMSLVISIDCNLFSAMIEMMCLVNNVCDL